MGSCASKKKKASESQKPSDRAIDQDSPEGSIYNVVPFDPKLNSEFKEDEVDIIKRASKLAKQPEKVPAILVKSPNHDKPKRKPKSISQSSSSEERIKGSVKNNRVMIAQMNNRYAAAVPKNLVKFQCGAIINPEVNFGVLNTLLFQNGLIFIPKENARNQPGFFRVSIEGKIKNIYLWMSISDSLIFKVEDFQSNGFILQNCADVQPFMKVNIANKFYDLNQDKVKKNYYSCIEELPDDCIGQIIYIDSKPGFLIEKKNSENIIKILPLKSTDSILNLPTLEPAIPALAISFLNKQNSQVISTGFRIENFIFTNSIQEISMESIQAVANGLELKIASEYLRVDFLVFEIISAEVTGIEIYKDNIGTDKAFIMSPTGKIEFCKAKKYQDKYKVQAQFKVTQHIKGVLIYNDKHQPFAVVTNIINHSIIQITLIKHLIDYFVEKQSAGQTSNYVPDRITRSEDMIHSNYDTLRTMDFGPMDDSQQVSYENFNRIKQEGGQDMEEVGSFNGSIEIPISQSSKYSTLRPVHVEPEEISYLLTGKTLLKYSSEFYIPQKIDLEINSKPGSTFTTTSKGLVIIEGLSGQLIQGNETTQLPRLNHPHIFHSTVFHQEQVYVIGGKNCLSVESFQLQNDSATWKEECETPVMFQEAAACSDGHAIFVLNSGIHDSSKSSAYKFSGRWEFISWQVPEFAGMGMISYANEFVLFGGKGKNALNDCFYVFDRQGCIVTAEEFQIPGIYYNKAIGRTGDVFCIGTDEKYFLEFHNRRFRVIVMG